MVLSKRERLILIATIVVVGLLGAERLVYKPVHTKLTELDTERTRLVNEVNAARSLFNRRKRLEPKWRQMLDEGFRTATDAESRVFRALGDWQRQAGLYVTSTKPDRLDGENGLKEMTFVLAGEGTLHAVARFLWLVETSPLPVKVKQMTLSSSSEAGEAMSLQLRLSALYLDPEAEATQESESEVNDEELI